MRYEESLTAGSDSDRKRLASRNPVKAILCLSEESWGEGERGWRMGWLMDSEDMCVCVCMCVWREHFVSYTFIIKLFSLAHVRASERNNWNMLIIDIRETDAITMS